MTSPPNWIARMTNAVSDQMYEIDVLSPLGCHYFYNKEDRQWEVSIFASSTETVGGRNDGRITPSKFFLDLRGLLRIFPKVRRFHWQALSLDEGDDVGPHISVEAEYEGHPVWLRILASAPRGIEPGRYVHAHHRRLENNW